MSEDRDLCAECGREVMPLYWHPTLPKKMICFPCLNNKFPNVVDAYPGWREREQERGRKAEVAWQNFSHGGGARVLGAGD